MPKKNNTSVIQEYLDLHQTYVDKLPHAKVVTIYQLGSFHEMFEVDEPRRAGVDTREVSKLLNIALTRQNKKGATSDIATVSNPRMVGFNTVSLDKYVSALVREGWTVVQVDQVTEPPNPKREVVQVHSLATSYLEEQASSPQLLTIVAEEITALDRNKKVVAGLARLDLSTGEAVVLEVGSEDEIGAWLQRCTPREVLLHTSNAAVGSRLAAHRWLQNGVAVHRRLLSDQPDHVRPAYQNHVLAQVCAKTGPLTPLEALGLERSPLAARAWVHAIEFARDHDAALLHQLGRPTHELPQQHMALDRDALSDLRVVRRGDGDPSLLDVVKKTLTAMGGRLLRERLVSPVRDPKELARRYDGVERVGAKVEQVRLALRDVLDLPRLHRRWELGRLDPAAWVRLLKSYVALEPVHSLLPEPVVATLEQVRAASAKVIDLDAVGDEDEILILPGVSRPVDELAQEVTDLKAKVAAMEEKLSEAVGGNVKIQWTDKYGFTAKTTPKRSKTWLQDHADWQCRTQGSVARMWNNQVMQWGEKLVALNGRLRGLVQQCYRDTLASILQTVGRAALRAVAHGVAELDVHQSAAWCAQHYKYCRPTVGTGLTAAQLRHAIVERVQTREGFVPNDVALGGNNKSVGMCLFAPNAAGKSTLMTAVGLAVVMAQAGLFVPASSFTWDPVDALFTRINASDRVGVSSFVAEMLQLRNILHRATPRSLVLSDEACNMTEVTSALSLSAATLHHLVTHRVRFFFATHLHRLTKLACVNALLDQGLAYQHLRVDEVDGALVYLRTLQDGPGPAVYGLRVAQHVLAHPTFWTIAREVQEALDAPPAPRKSRYNAGIFLDRCAICHQHPADDAHHIKFQRDADADGFHAASHKDAAHNLVGLCHTCHTRLHAGEITVKGWIQTTDGLELEVC